MIIHEIAFADDTTTFLESLHQLNSIKVDSNDNNSMLYQICFWAYSTETHEGTSLLLNQSSPKLRQLSYREHPATHKWTRLLITSSS